MYDSNVIQVGRDQKQHLEVTRDIASKWNQTYGETFVIPEPQISDAVSEVTGTDGKKMFIFSSRRLHTIALRDWSSDVCSSDLRNGSAEPCGLGKYRAPKTHPRFCESR